MHSRFWGKTSAIPDLQRAIDYETNEAARLEMQQDLATLMARQKTPRQ